MFCLNLEKIYRIKRIEANRPLLWGFYVYVARNQPVFALCCRCRCQRLNFSLVFLFLSPPCLWLSQKISWCLRCESLSIIIPCFSRNPVDVVVKAKGDWSIPESSIRSLSCSESVPVGCVSFFPQKMYDFYCAILCSMRILKNTYIML